MLIILFGPAGVGKTYIGHLLANFYGFYYQDGDDWLTENMVNAIEQSKPFSQEMRDEFTKIVIANIKSIFSSGNRNIVISQALYKQKNREQILGAFPNSLFIQVDAKPEVISKRLSARGNNIIPEFANLIRKDFEPMPNSFIIDNNQDEEKEHLLSSIINILNIHNNRK
jgi:gluconate kinase